MSSSTPKPPIQPPLILKSASGEVNRIRRLIAYLRSQISGSEGNLPDDPNAPLPTPSPSLEDVLECQRIVWVRIFEHLKITNPDPNNKDVKSGVLFEAMEKVAKKISEVGRTGNTIKSEEQEMSTYSFLKNNDIKEQDFENQEEIKYKYDF
ncbi:20360_t:CDS:1 [Dentiscutata erythropus]|uniref:20360_t:CDS:1 n=1 Tax=Dentiscutata erythropus TaxID=1348616 RepID=A0A9N9HS22_9GLOM|nr:20360_t:CDS:1 [Dentiscutata erythropus]